MPDIDLKCSDCGNDFYFSEKDQSFYTSKGFSTPKRCHQYRQKRKDERAVRQAEQLPVSNDFNQTQPFQERDGNSRYGGSRRGRDD